MVSMNRKPTINVICNNINQPLLKWVLAGIEEEGISVQTTFRMKLIGLRPLIRLQRIQYWVWV